MIRNRTLKRRLRRKKTRKNFRSASSSILGGGGKHPIPKRPKHPESWNADPDEWLSNFDIHAVMEEYEKVYPHFVFLGPVPIDFASREKGKGQCVSAEMCAFNLAKMATNGKTDMGVVFNLSTSKEKGSHWVSLYIHQPIYPQVVSKGSDWTKDTAYALFFDSGCSPPPPEVDAFVQRLRKENPNLQYDNNARTGGCHQKGGTECGMYALFFMITMLTGVCGGPILHKMGKQNIDTNHVCPTTSELSERDKADIFLKVGGRPAIPDKFVAEFRKIYFSE